MGGSRSSVNGDDEESVKSENERRRGGSAASSAQAAAGTSSCNRSRAHRLPALRCVTHRRDGSSAGSANSPSPSLTRTWLRPQYLDVPSIWHLGSCLLNACTHASARAPSTDSLRD
eukprot:GHVU01124079.1.p2 GENE.GHVU01124079.1~~GHVU01124079.1.p2  ORF type:complete len:116 (-),score=6.22 GHVU01124079.1:414-761(-)